MKLLCLAVSLLTLSTSFAALPQANVLYKQTLFASPKMAQGGSALAKHEVSKGKKLPVAKDAYGVAQYRIPQITQLANGTLVVATSARLSLPSDYGWSTTFFAHSKDQGKTWEYIRRSTDYASDRTPKGNKAGPFPLTDGTQDTVVIHHPKSNKFVALYIEKVTGKLFTTQSKNLKAWSRPIPLPENKDFTYLCPGPASPQIDPHDGSIIMMVHGASSDKTKNGTYFVKSRDGKRFLFSDQPMPGSEASVVALGKGKYLAQSRGGQRRMAIFENGTWTSTFTFPGKSYPKCEASLARHGDTLYFLTPTGPKRNNGVLYRSKDEGKTWQEVCQVTNDYFSYSSMTVLDDKRIAIVYEANFAPAKHKLMNIDFLVIELPEE